MADIKNILDEIKALTVVELNDLVKAIEEEFGVSAAAMAVAAPAAVEATDETDMAAIAYVLHTFYNQHDEESDVLTIRHDDVAYSPWNQKSITF